MGVRIGRVIHPSWVIGWCSLGLILGTAVCAVVNPQLFNDPVWAILAGCLLSVILIRRYDWMLPLAVVAGGLIGLWHGSVLRVGLEAYKPYYGQTVTLQGRVAQDASYGATGDQRLNLTAVTIGNQQFPGKVWVSLSKNDIKRGDIVTFQGLLNPGFGNLSATMYRAQIKQTVRPHPGDVARRVRDWFGEGARRAIPEPQVSLGLGYLVGQRTALPKDLEEDIRAVGLTHAVVASGYNLTILVVFCRALFLKVSKYFATLASTLLVLSFMLITGLSPSMSRAGLVACLGLLVWYYGRKMHPFVLLSFAAAITVAIDPSYVWGDLGWYLSFGSFIGVIVLAPLVQHYFWGLQEKVPMLRQLIVDTLSAQVATLPLILLAFGQYPVYALPANILVLPLVPLAMLSTFIAGIAGLVVPGLAPIFGFPATLILSYSIEVIKRFADLPESQKELTFNPMLMIASYSAICIVIAYLIRSTNHDFRGTNQPEQY